MVERGAPGSLCPGSVSCVHPVSVSHSSCSSTVAAIGPSLCVTPSDHGSLQGGMYGTRCVLRRGTGYVGQLQSQRPFLKGATLLLEKWGIRRALREGETVAPATPGAGACVARVGGGSRCVPVTCLRCQWSLSDLQGAASQVGTVPGSGFRCSQRSGQLDQPQSHLPRS